MIKSTFSLTGLHCAACAQKVETILNHLDGISEATSNYATREANVTYDEKSISPEQMRAAIRRYGYDLLIELSPEEIEAIELRHHKKLQMRTIVAAALALPILILSLTFHHPSTWLNIILWIMSSIVIFGCGQQFFINAYKRLRNFTSDMDSLIALSAGIAYLFSVFNVLFPHFWMSRGITPHSYFDASACIIALVLIGRLLENRAKQKTTASIKKLIGLQPTTTIVILPDGTHCERPIGEVMVGDSLLARPGDKIAVDGIILEGESLIDESMMTGEPIPAEAAKGKRVYAGTINLNGSITYKAQLVGKATMLSRIIALVKEAQGSKAPIQHIVDKIAAIFVPTIIIISIMTFAAWLVFATANGFTLGLLSAVTVLVIACPCALGLATPTAITVGIGRAAENGILIKNAISLEQANNIDTIILDKTGTLTEGEPCVVHEKWFGDADMTKSILYSIERRSSHPLSTAITSHLDGTPTKIVLAFRNIPGQGLSAKIDGTTYHIGNMQLLRNNNINIDDDVLATSHAWSMEGGSIVIIADESSVLGMLSIADRLKSTSLPAIKSLKEMGIDIHICSGDSVEAAGCIARQLGIKHYRGMASPEDKSKYITSLQQEGHVVAMVGDGINDSAALSIADFSIAMGNGSDIAIDVAQMTIISGDLTRLRYAIKLSKDTAKTIRQNLFWALIYNCFAIPIAAGILYPINGFLLNPMVACALMAFSSVSVVTNSLRLRHKL